MKTLLKKLAFIVLLLNLLPSVAVQAQFLKGDENVTKSERKILNFQYVEVEDGIDLYLSQGSALNLNIEADQNLHQYIVTEVKGDILKIYLSKSVHKCKSLKVYLKFVDLKGITASSGSDVVSSGILKLENLSVICSGGSDAKLTIEVSEFKFKASGGSDGFIRGKANAFNAIASGGSDIKAFELEAGNCSIEVTGGSDAEVNTNGQFKARGSGGSDISYKGNPTNIDSNMSGGSDLFHR